jgi:Cdc6-like AAA superfamily ATPase
MGRQGKVTESYAVKKSQGLRLTVKRKVLADEDEENVAAKCDVAPPVGIDIAQDFDNYQTAKNALHLSTPGTLIAREEQLNEVYSWLDERLKGRLAGSIYISGAPGTGKTAVVLQSIQQWIDNNSAKTKGPQPLYQLVINCMSLGSPTEIYEQMAPIILVNKKTEGSSTKEKVFNKLMSGNHQSKMLYVYKYITLNLLNIN